jgi:hypothetical protein
MKNKVIELSETTVGIIIESKKFGIKIVSIDREDLPRVSAFSWMLCPHKHTVYAKSTSTLCRVGMHRLIMSFPTGKVIDHFDKCGINNTKTNLKICSYSQNSMRRKKSENSPCKYKGVYPTPNSTKFRASIRHNGKFIHLGYHPTQEIAAMAYNKAATQYFGEFAESNLIT